MLWAILLYIKKTANPQITTEGLREALKTLEI